MDVNIDIMHRFQSNILITITGSPRYIRNENIHIDLCIIMIRSEIKSTKSKLKTDMEKKGPLDTYAVFESVCVCGS